MTDVKTGQLVSNTVQSGQISISANIQIGQLFKRTVQAGKVDKSFYPGKISNVSPICLASRRIHGTSHRLGFGLLDLPVMIAVIFGHQKSLEIGIRDVNVSGVGIHP